MSDKPAPKTPPPPRTKSGEVPSVREFLKEVEKYNDETIPKMDHEVDRMEELCRKVSSSPAEKQDRVDTPIPAPPRSPSFIDEEERTTESTRKAP